MTAVRNLLLVTALGAAFVVPLRGQGNPELSPSSEAVHLSAARIKEIRSVEEDGSVKVSIHAENPIRNFKYFELDDPDRLVVDVWDAIKGLPSSRIPLDSGLVKSVRVGQHSRQPHQVVRVVLEIDPKAVEGRGSGNLKKSGIEYDVRSEQSQVLVTFRRNPAGSTEEAGDSGNGNSSEEKTALQSLEGAESPPATLPSDKAESTSASTPSTADIRPLSAMARPVLRESASMEIPMQPLPAPLPPPLRVEPSGGPTVEVRPERPPLVAPTLPSVQQNPASAQQRLELVQVKEYTGEPISVNLVDVTLVDFFRLISEISALNIILDPNVQGTLTIKVEKVPWDQLFDIVLKNNGLAAQLQGNIVRIATQGSLEQEEQQKRKLREAEILAADLITHTIKLNYAKATDVQKIVEKQLSPRGQYEADVRTNTAIVKDVPSFIPPIVNLMQGLDVPQRQVEIEARIVSATRDFARDIGIQFGFVGGNLERVTVGGPNTFGTIGGTRPIHSPSTAFIAGRPSTGRGAAGESASGGAGVSPGGAGNLNVNLPTQQATSGFGISIGNIFDTFLLDAAITAAENKGLAKLISQPKVTAQNNSEAVITQGLRFPVQVIQNNTVTVQFFDAALQLTVTPQITAEGTVLLRLNVQNNEAYFGRHVNGVPSIRTSESVTSVLVSDGGTTVIGGILIDSEDKAQEYVPGLGSIPLIGELFKRRSVSRTTQEILFFVTPKILQ
ncbi:MAG: type IV pilus secretin PilQ [Acidobacteria bacterium]|nr:type IV pilus secretin PilQ [Acidobacteriota bacterium]